MTTPTHFVVVSFVHRDFVGFLREVDPIQPEDIYAFRFASDLDDATVAESQEDAELYIRASAIRFFQRHGDYRLAWFQVVPRDEALQAVDEITSGF